MSTPKVIEHLQKNQVVLSQGKKKIFQSYDSIIAIKDFNKTPMQITLDKNYWDYSQTTGKYRNIFLGMDKKETEKQIKQNIIKLKDLNK